MHILTLCSYSIRALTNFVVNLITMIPFYNSFENFTVYNNPIISTPNLCKTFHQTMPCLSAPRITFGANYIVPLTW